MKLATVLSGQAFIFRSLKEVLAKANELKSGAVLAGVAASSDLVRQLISAAKTGRWLS